MATEQDCVDALREAARKLGGSPTKAEYEELGLTPASATIIRTLGGWNAAKERAGLATNRSTGSRVGPPPEDVDDEIRRHWEELSVDQRWHYRNVAWNTERTLQQRATRRERLNERAAAAGCSACGESDPRCLDFHHSEPAEKVGSISELVTRRASEERLEAELENCVVLCANCHRERHAADSPVPAVELQPESSGIVTLAAEKRGDLTTRERQRVWVRSYKARRGCSECGYGEPAGIDLHHVNPHEKTASVGRMISDGCSTERLSREVMLCEPVCSNCHRKLHAADRA